MVQKDKQKKPASFSKRLFWMLAAGTARVRRRVRLQGVHGRADQRFLRQHAAARVCDHRFRGQDRSEWADAEESVGTFVAINGTEVTTEAGGIVRSLSIEPGQPVKAGTVLVQLNTTNELAVLRSLEAAAKLATVQRDRWRELGKDKLVSQAEVEERSTTAATTLAQVEAQRALIAQKTIRAPFSGVLGLRKVNLGQFVNPGDPIVSLAVDGSDLPRLLAARAARGPGAGRHPHPRHGRRPARPDLRRQGHRDRAAGRRQHPQLQGPGDAAEPGQQPAPRHLRPCRVRQRRRAQGGRHPADRGQLQSLRQRGLRHFQGQARRGRKGHAGQAAHRRQARSSSSASSRPGPPAAT